MPIFFIIFVHFTNQSFDDRVSSENNLQFFRWFSIKSFDTAKYELIVQHLFMTALITDSSSKFGQPDPICQNNKGCGLLKNHVKNIPTVRKRWQNYNTIMFCETTNFWNNLLVRKLLKRTNFHSFFPKIYGLDIKWFLSLLNYLYN